MSRVVIHLANEFSADRVVAAWSADLSRCIVPEVAEAIEAAWSQASSRPGVLLFDGPMCRLESWSVRDDQLSLVLSRTSYKPFFGTNLHNPHLADRFGTGVLANPLGVSPALETSDGYLVLGRRNANVAYYPNRVHPFAGSVEPPGNRSDAIDLFGEVRRELFEELRLGDSDIAAIRCIGLAEDRGIRQPELIFGVTTTRTRKEVTATLDAAEHAAVWALPAEQKATEQALHDPELTPIAVASLLLWGRLRFGDEWFAAKKQQTDR